MKKFVILPLIAAAALGLTACTKHTDGDNAVVGNDTSLNSSDDLTINSEDSNASADSLGNEVDTAAPTNTAGN